MMVVTKGVEFGILMEKTTSAAKALVIFSAGLLRVRDSCSCTLKKTQLRYSGSRKQDKWSLSHVLKFKGKNSFKSGINKSSRRVYLEAKATPRATTFEPSGQVWRQNNIFKCGR